MSRTTLVTMLAAAALAASASYAIADPGGTRTWQNCGASYSAALAQDQQTPTTPNMATTSQATLILMPGTAEKITVDTPHRAMTSKEMVVAGRESVVSTFVTSRTKKQKDKIDGYATEAAPEVGPLPYASSLTLIGADYVLLSTDTVIGKMGSYPFIGQTEYGKTPWMGGLDPAVTKALDFFKINAAFGSVIGIEGGGFKIGRPWPWMPSMLAGAATKAIFDQIPATPYPWRAA